MRRVLIWAAALLLSLIAAAQQTPPATGVGTGNERGASQSSGALSKSPDQNARITGTMGTTSSGDNATGLAGSSEANTATNVNAEGTMSTKPATAAIDARRAPYSLGTSSQNRAEVVQNGNQVKPTLGSAQPQQ